MTIARAALVLLMATVPLVSASGLGIPYVICVGSDGHVRIETSAEGACGAGTVRTAGPIAVVPGFASDLGDPPGHCGACLDIPMSAGRIEGGWGARHREIPAPELAGRGAPFALGASSGDSASPDLETLRSIPATLDPSISLIATVVLLI